MKNRYSVIKIIFLIFLLNVNNACEDILEKTPDGTMTLDEVLSDYDRTKGLLSAAYSQMVLARDNLFFFQTLETLSDNGFEPREDGYSSYWWNSGQLSKTNACVWPGIGFGGDPGNAPTAWWGINWKGVRFANIAINEIPNSTVVSELEKSRWINQAKLLRAYYYFQLIQFYGPLPFFDVPFEADFSDWKSLERPTYHEIATRIADECDEVIASGYLPLSRPTNELALLPAGFAYALKSRVLLYNASPLNNPENDKTKWQLAADAAKDLLDLEAYYLVDIDQYESLFTSPFATNVPEIIYRSHLEDSHIGNVNGISLANYGLANCHKTGDNPTQELVDCFEMKNGAIPVSYINSDHTSVTINPAAIEAGYGEGEGDNPYLNRDERFYKNILFNGADFGVPSGVEFNAIIETFVGGGQGFNDNVSSETKFSCTGYYARKGRDVRYYGPNGLGNGVAHHMVIFRLAEAYLNYAEALCELDDLNGAMEQLNVIRERANQPRIQDIPGFTSTKEFIRERIRNERRVEFCMEDLRFFDQRRWKILGETNKVVTGMRITKVADNVFNYQRVKVYDRLSYTDKYLVLPIAQDEAKKLSGIEQPEPWR
ncbi:RagB/SusD family nutrient uptake outer membrane protein [Sunxiuqinia sp. A32]|uniref:RagB/SusD family nutrient uptake outer membrane protein n=1 Tax=Sunxiuqinia sp. A32 TaxID=3461496 RepID=UPI0040453DED